MTTPVRKKSTWRGNLGAPIGDTMPREPPPPVHDFGYHGDDPLTEAIRAEYQRELARRRAVSQ